MIRNLKGCRADQQNDWPPGRLRKPDMCTSNSKSVKPKTKRIELVCVNLSISTVVYLTKDLNTN